MEPTVVDVTFKLSDIGYLVIAVARRTAIAVGASQRRLRMRLADIVDVVRAAAGSRRHTGVIALRRVASRAEGRREAVVDLPMVEMTCGWLRLM
jgi:hypothetical protein